MRIKRKEILSACIFIILFFAAFNDIIRIPNTVFSIYRLMIPIILSLALYYIKETWIFFFGGILLLVPLFIQNLIFCKVLKVEATIDLDWQFTYFIHYGYIIVIFILIRILRSRDINAFKKIFTKFIPIVGVLCIFFYLISISPYYGSSGLANRNNYAVCLAAVFPWYFTKTIHGKIQNSIICIAILAALWIGDSKAALAGIIIEIGVIAGIQIIKRLQNGNRLVFLILILIVITGILICFSPLDINGYKIKEMFVGMLSHIAKGEPYRDSGSSLSYRTNAIIYMLKGITESGFMGIGVGNTGKLLAQMMPDAAQEVAKSFVSPHCAVLEFFCDCGIAAIILCLYIYYRAIKKMFHAKELGQIDIYFVSFTLSFPMWSMSASGLYTIYIVFIIIAWLYEWKILNKKESLSHA